MAAEDPKRSCSKWKVKLLFKQKESKINKAVNLSIEKYCGVMEMFRRFAKITTNVHIHNS